MNSESTIVGPVESTTLRPLLWWLFLSVFLFTWKFHQRHEQHALIDFTVTLESRAARPVYQAELNGESFEPGRHSGLWRKTLTVTARDAEPFTTNLFVWYGGKNLGRIMLTRSRGTLDLSTKPAANRVSVDGLETNKAFRGTAHESLILPTGRYTIKAQFARFTTNQEVEILAHQTSRAVIDPGITQLALSSHPTNAEFELTSPAWPEISIRSNTPITLTDLPSGAYQLRIWRGDYQKTVPLKLDGAEVTNKLQIEFDYAQLAITSQPDGAQIREGEKVIGTTPATLTLPTGLHRFEVAKGGFQVTNFSLTLEAKAKRTVSVVLPSLAYLEAIEQVSNELSGAFPELDRALREVTKALEIQPDDPAALQLKQAIVFKTHLHDARELQRSGAYGKAKTEVEAAMKFNGNDPDALSLKADLDKELQSVAQARAATRREHPAKIFQNEVSRLLHQDLFTSQKLSTSGQMDATRAAVVRALGGKSPWNIRHDEKLDDDTSIIQADTKGLGSRQSVLLIVGQTAGNATEIHFKLLEFTLGSSIHLGLSGISDDSYKPLHPSYGTTENAASIQLRLTRDLDAFRKRIEAELH